MMIERAHSRTSRPWERLAGCVRLLCFLLLTSAPSWASGSSFHDPAGCRDSGLAHFPGTCANADFDGDRRTDEAISTNLSGVGGRLTFRVQLSQGQPSTEYAMPRLRPAYALATRDIDSDGDVDVILIGFLNQRVGVFLNDGSGHFEFDESGSYLAPSGVAETSWSASRLPVLRLLASLSDERIPSVRAEESCFTPCSPCRSLPSSDLPLSAVGIAGVGCIRAP
ncbi:MAG: VCBS repeat-containing protein [Acidobacteria bacterium]|nr:VCBS repeat-containing protein [Acidobacteriota bacterium]